MTAGKAGEKVLNFELDPASKSALSEAEWVRDMVLS